MYTHTHSHTHIHRVDQRGLSDAEVADWKANTEYKGLSPTDQIVKWFWQVRVCVRVCACVCVCVRVCVCVCRQIRSSSGFGRHTIVFKIHLCRALVHEISGALTFSFLRKFPAAHRKIGRHTPSASAPICTLIF
jgi:hypothetical protein